MGIFDAVKKQFIDIIEWQEPSDDVLAWRFPVADNEIQNGAKLTVRASQAALLVDKGQLADLFGPGLHVLKTENLPILTTLENWHSGFKSPFKTDVYFFSLRQKLGQRWGTPQPVTVRDREFGSVQVRMFGVLSYHVADPRAFFQQVSATREAFTTEDLAGQLVPQIAGAAAAVFGQSGVPFLDMAANQVALGNALQAQLGESFGKLGLALDGLVVQSVSLPDALQKALQDKQSMGIVGNLSQYAQYQMAKSIPDAAQNPSGLAGIGAGVAVGAGFGSMMMGAMQGAVPGAGAATKACVACGKGIDADAPFCRHCGKPQQHTCPSCKAVSPGDAAFCAKCGTKLG